MTGMNINFDTQTISFRNSGFSNLVTKDDLKRHNALVNTKIDTEILKLNQKISELKFNTLKWLVVAMMFAQTGIIIAFMKMFFQQ